MKNINFEELQKLKGSFMLHGNNINEKLLYQLIHLIQDKLLQNLYETIVEVDKYNGYNVIKIVLHDHISVNHDIIRYLIMEQDDRYNLFEAKGENPNFNVMGFIPVDTSIEKCRYLSVLTNGNIVDDIYTLKYIDYCNVIRDIIELIVSSWKYSHNK